MRTQRKLKMEAEIPTLHNQPDHFVSQTHQNSHPKMGETVPNSSRKPSLINTKSIEKLFFQAYEYHLMPNNNHVKALKSLVFMVSYFEIVQ